MDLQVVQAGRRVSSNADHGPATRYKTLSEVATRCSGENHAAAGQWRRPRTM